MHTYVSTTDSDVYGYGVCTNMLAVPSLQYGLDKKRSLVGVNHMTTKFNWLAVGKAAARVAKWPAWKRNYRLTKYSKGFDDDGNDTRLVDDDEENKKEEGSSS